MNTLSFRYIPQTDNMSTSVYWYDYETFGINPALDRISQFGGVRTDPELNIIGDPLVLYSKPGNDYLPDPTSVLITGITPQIALEKGLPEVEFIHSINQEFSQPATCVCGYNNIRFDDEFTRYTLYRNLFDAYAREWKNDNSRWDLIDIVRLAYALRPEGIEWPLHKNGTPSFRLADLSKANMIEHESAHDAMSDVYATIGVARLIRQNQPKLYDYVFSHRKKTRVAELLNLAVKNPIVHISGMYPARYARTSVIMPLARHPTNKNGVIVYDLRENPEEFLELDIDEMRARLFSPHENLPEGVKRLPLKTVHLNKCPVVVPINTLDDKAQQRTNIDLESCLKHHRALKDNTKLEAVVAKIYADPEYEKHTDPDTMLYSGGFFGNADRQAMEEIHKMSPQQIGDRTSHFDDGRLDEMLFRFRARNYPDTLNETDVGKWRVFCDTRLKTPGTGARTHAKLTEAISKLRLRNDITGQELALLDELESYAKNLLPFVG